MTVVMTVVVRTVVFRTVVVMVFVMTVVVMMVVMMVVAMTVVVMMVVMMVIMTVVVSTVVVMTVAMTVAMPLLTYRVVASGHGLAGRANGGAVIGWLGGVDHVHHGHAEVDPQGVHHEEAIAGDQRQAVARRAARRR